MKLAKSAVQFARRRISTKPSTKISTLEDSIWSEFTPLAIKNNAVNLGQGFPDWQTEPFVLESLKKQLSQKVHQYARAAGDLTLVQQISKTYSPLFNRTLDPMKEILVTNGASGGLFNGIQSFINAGDEVIIIEPFYDLYPSNVLFSQAKPVFVPLREKGSSAEDWVLDIQELKSKISKKTRAIILNNPHNPTGKVFSKVELEQIAQVAIENDLLVFSDEVYEFLVFGKDNQGKALQHTRIATLPGMWERTLTICSAGKTFSNTGWKMGWIIGPAPLIFNAYMVNQYTVFSVATPLQKATAECLEHLDQYIPVIQDRLRQRSSFLENVFTENGIRIVRAGAGYFFLADISKIRFENFVTVKYNDDKARDYQFCRWLPTSEVNCAAIPPSAFMTKENQHLVQNYARFCFSKEQETLDKAKIRFANVKKYF